MLFFKMICALAICISLLNIVSAYKSMKKPLATATSSSTRGGTKGSTSLGLRTDNNDDDAANKFKVVDASDISKLFDSIPTASESDEDEDEEYDWEEEDDDEEEGFEKENIEESELIVMTKKDEEDEEDTTGAIEGKDTLYTVVQVAQDKSLNKPITLDDPISIITSTRDTTVMEELRAMERAALSPILADTEAKSEINNIADFAVGVGGEVEKVMQATKEEEFNGYVDLNGVLDQKQSKQVRDLMTMKEAPDKVVPASKQRVFAYDPSQDIRVDPMKYGAYRRWKAPELEAPKTRRRKKGAKGSKSKQTNKKDGGFTTDSFYEAIKGIGGDRKGSSDSGGEGSGTTFGEPKDNRPPIQPNKPVPRKAKKKTITPEDIDSLFPSKVDEVMKGEEGKQKEEEEDYEEDYDEDDDDNNAPSKSTGTQLTTTTSSTARVGSISMTSTASTAAVPTGREFNPMDKDVPEWLQQATDAEKKRKKAAKRGKKKKLTDDWRFWAAIIASVGFVSAFINIYSQTGGFGGGPGPGAGLGGGGGMPMGGNELVI